MYLVTVLNGYHTRDIEQMIERGIAGGRTAPDGRFLLQNQLEFLPVRLCDPSAICSPKRALTSEVVTAPPANAEGVMGYFSGGIYSGLTPDTVTRLRLSPRRVWPTVPRVSAPHPTISMKAPHRFSFRSLRMYAPE